MLRAITMACVAHAAPSWMPASLRELEPVTLPGVWDEMVWFFRPGSGGSESYRIAIDTTCIATELDPAHWDTKHMDDDSRDGSWWEPKSFILTHGKWSTEYWLPMILSRSKWAASIKDETNATLVVYRSRASSRHTLSWCRQKLARHSPRWRGGADHWFTTISSRGPCCDGGQARDPSVMRHHFLTHVGEKRDGPWLFRESRFADRLQRSTQYKAPVTRDTAPFLRCFDNAKDVALPPPMLLLRRRTNAHDRFASEQARVKKCERSRGRDPASCFLTHAFQAAESKDVLVMHAEGKQGGMEYHLRRAMTLYWDKNFAPVHPIDSAWRDKRWRTRQPGHDGVHVRFSLPFANYTRTMQRAKYCVVSEGFSPWSPRLTESVAQGCVPVILSPSLELPYAASLDWTQFSVRIDEDDIPRLDYLLESLDHSKLHANLMRVRPLFAFCIDEGGEDGCGGNLLAGDGLPLVVFEMARRKRPGVGRDLDYDAESYRGTARLLAGFGPDGTDVDYSTVRFECALRNGSCDYELHDQTWRCDMVQNLATGSINPNSCQCRKKVGNEWAFVGTTTNLIGHKAYLWGEQQVPNNPPP